MTQEAPPAIPQQAHNRIAEMRQHKLFTCDLSINEFLSRKGSPAWSSTR